MARTGGVRVGQLVDQYQLGAAGKRSVEVKFAELHALVLDAPCRQHLKVRKQLHCFGARVRLHVADYHVHALFFRAVRRLEHRVGFADAGGVAEEYFQRPLALVRLAFQLREQLFWGGASHLFHLIFPFLTGAARRH